MLNARNELHMQRNLCNINKSAICFLHKQNVKSNMKMCRWFNIIICEYWKLLESDACEKNKCYLWKLTTCKWIYSFFFLLLFVSALQYTLDSVDLMIGITYTANKTHANFNPFTCSWSDCLLDMFPNTVCSVLCMFCVPQKKREIEFMTKKSDF